MKKAFMLLNVFLLFAFSFVCCSNSDDEGDGQIIESGTKISDFSGHKNSLDWLKGTFKDDNDSEKITDNQIEFTYFHGNYSTTYNILKIAYNSKEQEVGSYIAPVGSWTFDLVNADSGNSQEEEEDTGADSPSADETYVIEKINKDSFWLTHSSFNVRGNQPRKRV